MQIKAEPLAYFLIICIILIVRSLMITLDYDENSCIIKIVAYASLDVALTKNF